jgi:hypothetical protein
VPDTTEGVAHSMCSCTSPKLSRVNIEPVFAPVSK